MSPAKISEACDRCTARMMSICGALPEDDLRRLAEGGSSKRYKAGDVFTFESDQTEFVFSLTRGMVMLFRLLSNGRRQVLGFLFKGDFLGLSAGAEYGFSAQALNDVEVCRFPRPSFRRMLLEMPELEEELLSRASDELILSREHVTLLGRKTATERVASFLLHIADREAGLGGAPNLAFLPMTRSDIADYLGLTTETVSRIISTLKRQRTIQLIEHGGVRLLKREELKALSEAA